MRTALLAGIVAASLIAACSAASPTAAPSSASAPPVSRPSPTVAPTEPATPAATASSTDAMTALPTPTASSPPTFTSIVNELLGARHPPVQPGTVVAAIEASYAADPVWFSNNFGGHNLDTLLRQFTTCREGELGDGDFGPLEERLASSCAEVVGIHLFAYRATGIKAQYDAALAAYNYACNALPRVYVKGYIDDFLLDVAAQG
jgi:hypothetical protein